MMIKLPQIDNTQYEVTDQTWQQITEEVTDLKRRIDSDDDLTPNDVKQVRSLVRTVRNYGVAYRKAISKQATTYKQKLDETLTEIGYDEIEAYINKKRLEQQKEIEDRLNQKLTHFNQVVKSDVEQTTYLKNSALAKFINTNLSSRFPAINSGAKSKEIKDWKPIDTVITMTIQQVDQKMNEMPILNQLPVAAPIMQQLGQYIKTGNSDILDKLKPNQLDQQFAQKLILKQKVTTSKTAVDEIESVINSDVDADVKMHRIQMLMDAYRANV